MQVMSKLTGKAWQRLAFLSISKSRTKHFIFSNNVHGLYLSYTGHRTTYFVLSILQRKKIGYKDTVRPIWLKDNDSKCQIHDGIYLRGHTIV